MKKTDIKPLEDRVVIEPCAAPEKIGSIYLPEDAKKKPSRAKVICIGPGRPMDDGTTRAVNVKPGDLVVYCEYATNPIDVEGTKYHILRESDILAIVGWEKP